MIVNAVITNVGGTGYYDDVVDMIDGEGLNCSSFDDACVKEVRLFMACTLYNVTDSFDVFGVKVAFE